MLRHGYADDVVATNEISGMFSEIEVNLSERDMEFTGMVWLFCGFVLECVRRCKSGVLIEGGGTLVGVSGGSQSFKKLNKNF